MVVIEPSRHGGAYHHDHGDYQEYKADLRGKEIEDTLKIERAEDIHHEESDEI